MSFHLCHPFQAEDAVLHICLSWSHSCMMLSNLELLQSQSCPIAPSFPLVLMLVSRLWPTGSTLPRIFSHHCLWLFKENIPEFSFLHCTVLVLGCWQTQKCGSFIWTGSTGKPPKAPSHLHTLLVRLSPEPARSGQGTLALKVNSPYGHKFRNISCFFTGVGSYPAGGGLRPSASCQ